MAYDPREHDRRSVRLPGYDYTRRGTYFVTLCTLGRAQVFGTVLAGEMRLNELGVMVREEWLASAHIRAEVTLDEFVIMPNHFHALVVLRYGEELGGAGVVGESNTGGGRPPVAPTGLRPRSVGALLAGFKAATTRRMNQMRGTPGGLVWQRNYFEHIVRDLDALAQIRKYIRDNPRQWTHDRENADGYVSPIDTSAEPWQV